MRATLADASLARYAGQFVWLELDFDRPENQSFLARHGANYTPSFYIIDPNTEQAAATQLGAMTLSEVTQFLERGAHVISAKAENPADAELARGDQLLGQDQTASAAAAYRKALDLGGEKWAQRERALGAYTMSLMMSGQSQVCAETSAAEAPHLARGEMFGRVVLSGLTCANAADSEPWAEPARRALKALAVEAVSLPATVRDHRFQLYRQLTYEAALREDQVTARQWSNRWLDELDTTKPANDEERAALDIARVEAEQGAGDPNRILPALIASEQAMPKSYNASLRLAQMETEAKQYDKATAACDRGLKHVTGPIGRTWLLETKADALMGKGDSAAARSVLEEAMRSAQTIARKRTRDNNVAKISQAMKEAQAK